MLRVIIFLALLTPCRSFCQKTIPKADFTYVDSLARSISYHNDLYRLTHDLTKPFDSDLLKARAIFMWITDNIAYDWKWYNSGKEVKGPKCKTGQNCDLQYAKWEMKFLKKVIRRKKGVCSGYARLFKKMCDIAGLKAEIISGYTKTKPFQIGSTGAADHAWNAIWLNNEWHLLDATWAAGACYVDEDSGTLTGFVKKYDNYYWLTPFADFSRDHYPREAKWVFEYGYTKEKFANGPFIANYLLSDLQLLSPTTGIIEARIGDTIRFKFEYIGNLQKIQVNTNAFRNPDMWTKEKISRRRYRYVSDTLAIKKQRYITYNRSGIVYEFDYVVSTPIFYLQLLFDYKKVMRFRVTTKTD